MARSPVLLALVLSCAVGCEIESYSPPPRGPAPAGGPRPGPVGPGAPPGPAAPGPAAPPPPSPGPAPAATQGVCAHGQACFDLVQVAPGGIGPSQLVVIWTHPNDDVKVPPEVGYSAPLPAGARRVAIPISAIRAPSFGATFAQAWGYVLTVNAAQAGSPSPKNATGIAQMMFVHARGAAQQAPLMKDKFPNGMAEGTAPYYMQKRASHDGFLLAPPGSVFTLQICSASSPGCDLNYPNPS